MAARRAHGGVDRREKIDNERLADLDKISPSNRIAG